MFDPITFGIGFGLWKLGQYVYNEFNKPGTPPDPAKEKEIKELAVDPIFFAVAILAKFAKADGIVTKREVAKIEEILADIELTGDNRAKAIKTFSRHKEGALSYEESLGVYAHLTKDSDELRGGLCILLLRLAHADGSPPQRAIQDVQKACTICELDYNEVYVFFENIEQAKSATVSSAYEILGCSPNDSVDAVKRRYRHLTKTFHPDTIAGKELPPEFIKVAEAKFREIQEAYEKIILQHEPAT